MNLLSLFAQGDNGRSGRPGTDGAPGNPVRLFYFLLQLSSDPVILYVAQYTRMNCQYIARKVLLTVQHVCAWDHIEIFVHCPFSIL